jgi:hypothetical protein
MSFEFEYIHDLALKFEIALLMNEEAEDRRWRRKKRGIKTWC